MFKWFKRPKQVVMRPHLVESYTLSPREGDIIVLSVPGEDLLTEEEIEKVTGQIKSRFPDNQCAILQLGFKLWQFDREDVERHIEFFEGLRDLCGEGG